MNLQPGNSYGCVFTKLHHDFIVTGTLVVLELVPCTSLRKTEDCLEEFLETLPDDISLRNDLFTTTFLPFIKCRSDPLELFAGGDSLRIVVALLVLPFIDNCTVRETVSQPTSSLFMNAGFPPQGSVE